MATIDEPTTRSRSAPEIPAIRRDLFTRGAAWATRVTGGRVGFLSALGIVIFWAITGPIFHYSEIWQLVINTGTSVVTFLMVFLIQNAQNRESKAVHLKLDELILCVRAARNEMIAIEQLTDEQLDQLAQRYTKIAQRHQHKLEECLHEAAANGECKPAQQSR